MLETGLAQQAKPCRDTPQQRSFALGLARGPVALVLVGTFVLFLGSNFFYAGFPIHAVGAYDWSSSELGAFFAVL